jgi:hypothetical protein
MPFGEHGICYRGRRTSCITDRGVPARFRCHVDMVCISLDSARDLDVGKTVWRRLPQILIAISAAGLAYELRSAWWYYTIVNSDG